MSANCFYRFSYYAAASDSKKKRLLLHQLRDADAALELSGILSELGYQYGGLLLNYPAGDFEGVFCKCCVQAKHQAAIL